ncbi:group 1 glycosyl transferase [Amycolatopsis sp. AA4]|nr:group 1 glycosyl transferase [Amycolatopsis sp. AA4]
MIGVDVEVGRRMLVQGARWRGLRPVREVARVSGRPIRVLAVVHGFPPGLSAGSERMVEHLLRSLPAAEFETGVLSFGLRDAADAPARYEYRGLQVRRGFMAPFAPDVIVAHHAMAVRVLPSLAEEFPGAAVVLVHHNDRFDIPEMLAADRDLDVSNTEWVRESLGLGGIVVHPPLLPGLHEVEATGDAVTLVNLSADKGGHLFHGLAAQMPNTPFLGVEGAHGEQLPSPGMPNVVRIPTVQDMREVWKRTRVLLVPSAYESYGMVAAEACVNGIPVIAASTPGLRECLGDAGIFLDRRYPEVWADVLHLLLTDEDAYRERSERVRLRGAELAVQTTVEAGVFAEALRKLVT